MLDVTLQNTANLCSAYSIVVSILNDVFVWHGRGSSEPERAAMVSYARELASPDAEISEYEEGAENVSGAVRYWF